MNDRQHRLLHGIVHRAAKSKHERQMLAHQRVEKIECFAQRARVAALGAGDRLGIRARHGGVIPHGE